MFALLFSFGFLSPSILWGLSLLAVPVIIHLLRRRRYVETQWAAMQFLMAALQKQQRRLKFESWLLLALRLLAIAVLVGGLARPTVSDSKVSPAAAPRTLHIVAIDATLSMGAVSPDASAGETHFTQAIELARQIVNDASAGDAFQLVRISGRCTGWVISQPAFEKQQVLAELARLSLTDEQGGAEGAAQLIMADASRHGQFPRSRVYLISDLQQADWVTSSGSNRSSDASELASSAAIPANPFRELADVLEVVVLSTSQEATANLFIENVSLSESVVAAGAKIVVSAAIKADQATDSQQVSVICRIDDAVIGTQSIVVAAGQTASADFEVSLNEPGEFKVEVECRSQSAVDRLPTDNLRRTVVVVQPPISVFVCGPPTQTGEVLSTVEFVQLALEPAATGGPSLGPFRVDVAAEGLLSRTDLSRYQCVVLAGVSAPTVAEGDQLRRFVMSGGGLVIIPSANMNLASYNRALGGANDSSGSSSTSLLPGIWTGPLPEEGRPEEGWGLSTSELLHPIMRPFRGNRNAGLEQVRVLQGLGLARSETTENRVALRLQNDAALVVEQAVGRGRVVVWTTSLDRRWSTLGVWGHVFVPLLHETVRFAVQGPYQNRERLVGQPLPANDASAVTVQRLADGLRPAAGTAELLGTSVIDLAGFYRWSNKADPPVVELFALNANQQESRLVYLSPVALKEQVFAGSRVNVGTSWPLALAPRDEDSPVADSADASVAEAPDVAANWLLVLLGALLLEQLTAWNRQAARWGFVIVVSVLLGLLVDRPWGLILAALWLMAGAVVLAGGLRRGK